MVNKTISLPQEIIERLKLEENASGLITTLLTQHYKYNIDNSEDCDISLKNLEQKRKQMLEMIEKEKEKIIEIKNHVVEHEVNEKELERLRQEKRKALIKNTQDTALELFNKHITPEEAEEYIDGDYENLKAYLNIEDSTNEDENNNSIQDSNN